MQIVRQYDQFIYKENLEIDEPRVSWTSLAPFLLGNGFMTC